MARPPEPEILDFLTVHDGPVAGLALALREIVLDEAPDAVEKVYRNHPTAIWIGTGEKMNDMVFYIATTKTHVNLGLCRGASLPDPDGVLEGKGRVMRHFKIWDEEDLRQPHVRRYVRAALRQSASKRPLATAARKVARKRKKRAR